MKRVISIILILFALFVHGFGIRSSHAQEAQTIQEPVTVHFFGRDDCKHCQDEKSFFADLAITRSDYTLIYYNILEDSQAKNLFDQVARANELPRITPLTLIGHTLIQGFDTAQTTGNRFIEALDHAVTNDRIPLETFINQPELTTTGAPAATCGDAHDPFAPCDEDATSNGTGEFIFTLPIVGPVDLETFSLSTLSLVLGFIDGFNPCAMWVLVTFLLILLQIGNRKRMFQIAGLFILAEAIMYNLILNVWYQAWDFVGLDAFVTPFVGIVAIGGGGFFLYKYWKNKDKGLVCDVSSLEKQGKVEKKIHSIAEKPLTIAAVFAVIGIAFSVNVIEFACSVGIPQAFTKILDLNELSMLWRQTYIGIYTFAYMIDDFIVFGLALWGFNKLHLATKYSNLSALIGGILMLILGILLIFFPNALVF